MATSAFSKIYSTLNKLPRNTAPIGELVSAAGVSESTIYRYIKSGILVKADNDMITFASNPTSEDYEAGNLEIAYRQLLELKEIKAAIMLGNNAKPAKPAKSTTAATELPLSRERGYVMQAVRNNKELNWEAINKITEELLSKADYFDKFLVYLNLEYKFKNDKQYINAALSWIHPNG